MRGYLALAAIVAVSVVGSEAYVVPGAVVLASVGAVVTGAEEEDTQPVAANSRTKTSTRTIPALTHRRGVTWQQDTREEDTQVQVQEATVPAAMVSGED